MSAKHYCCNHATTVAWYGPVKGKFYGNCCHDIAYAEAKRESKLYTSWRGSSADGTNYSIRDSGGAYGNPARRDSA